jgi:Abortive infection alpha
MRTNALHVVLIKVRLQMVLVEAVTTAVTGGVILKILEPTLTSAGHKFKANLEIVLKKFDTSAQKRGVSLIALSEVPLKLLQPILEGAGNEEDDWMQSRWADLLTSASDASTQPQVHPGFADVLRQVTPTDAKLFEYVFNATILSIDETTPPDEYWHVLVEDVQSELKLNPFDLEVSADNLIRLGLFRLGGAKLLSSRGDKQAKIKRHENEVDWENLRIPYKNKCAIALSAYGWRFGNSCGLFEIWDESVSKSDV